MPHDELIKLVAQFKSDKWNFHWYAQHYARYFGPLRKKRLNLLEIGVGGYGDPHAGANSLRMWKAYFPHGRIYGIDLFDKREHEEERIKIFRGSQDDVEFLKSVAAEIGRIDIVIDDGSHENRHTITTFQTLFPLIHERGIYVVEDTQMSYWPGFGGSSDEINSPHTTMGYFKTLVDGLNYEELIRPGYAPSYYDRHIVAMHFYHNLLFILKGDNTEGSPYITKNTSDAEWITKDYKIGAGYHPRQPSPGRA